MTRFYALCATLCLWLLTGTNPAQADALPIKIEVDLSGITNIEDFPQPEVLEAEVIGFLNQHIDDELFEHWYVASGAGITKLSLSIKQADVNRTLNIRLVFDGDEEKRIRFRGLKPDSKPRQAGPFSADLEDALYDLVDSKADAIFSASEFVHAETDDGLKTVLRLDRPLDPQSALYFFEEKLELHWDHLSRGITVDQTQGSNLYTHMQLNAGETRSAVVRPDVKQSHVGALPLARFCVHRPLVGDPDGGAQPAVTFSCPLEGTCALATSEPAGWATDQCAVPARFDHSPPKWAWGAAYADTHTGETWSVPELDVLYDRVENFPGRFVGFTEFVIRAEGLRGLDADAYTSTIRANDTPILVNGSAPQDRLRPFDPARGLLFRFGLENLKFAGRSNGCEALSVAFQFYKDGVAVGDAVILQRGYAALRHAAARRFDTPLGVFSWTGDYVSPSERNESALFLQSALYATGNPASERRALETLNTQRRAFDRYGWRIKARDLGLGLGLESVLSADTELAIIGKLRPPRTVRANGDAAYGLLVGVQEPSGQMQFTFDRDQRRALQAFLSKMRARTPGSGAVVPGEFYVYSYSPERRVGPDWVC